MNRAYKTKGGRILYLTEDQVKEYSKQPDDYIPATDDDIAEYNLLIGNYPSHYLRVYYPHWSQPHLYDGYGYMAHLHKRNAYLAEIALENENKGQSVTLCHHLPDKIEKTKTTGLKIVYTMWETDKWPQHYLDSLNKADMVIVPTEWNKKSLQRQKIKKPIKVVGCGIDSVNYPAKKRVKGHDFRFVMPRIMNSRKGWEYAIEAFKRAFPDPQGVELVMKSHTPFIGSNGVNVQIVPYYHTPGVRWVYEMTPREKMADFYHQYECLVFPSKGEGWGLPIHEALLTGMPVIGVQGNGTDVFVSAGYLQVKGEKRRAQFVPEPPLLDGKPLWQMTEQDKEKAKLNVGNWVYADIDELAAAMRQVYENFEEWGNRAMQSSEIMRQKYDISVTMHGLKQAIDELLTQNLCQK